MRTITIRDVLIRESLLLSILFCLYSIYLLCISDSDILIKLILLTCSALFLLIKSKLGISFSFTFLSVPSFFILVFSAVLMYPSFYAADLLDGDIKYWFVFCLSSVYVFVPLGVLIFNLVADNVNNRLKKYHSLPILKTKADKSFIVLIIISFVLILSSTILYIINADFIQLYEIFKEYPTSYGVLEFRFGAEKVPKLILGIFELSRRLLLPLCIMFMYTLSRLRGKKWTFFLIVMFPLGFLVSLLTLDRSPPVALFGSLALINIVLPSKSFILKIARIVFYLMAAGLVGGLVSCVQYQKAFDKEVIFYNSHYVLSYRIGQDAAYSAAKVFRVYDSKEKQLKGRFIRMFSFLPGRKFRHSFENLKNRELRILAPCSFVGDLWRNWGYVGVILGSIWVGFFYQFIQVKILNKKSYVGTTIKVIIFVSSIWIIWGNMFGIVTTSVLLLTVLLGRFSHYSINMK